MAANEPPRVDGRRGKHLAPSPSLREFVGPSLVIVGASMWGLETLWRVRLLATFDADVLVFHEHWLGLLLTMPFLIRGAGALRSISRKAVISMVASGVLGSALGTVCFTEALTLLNASLANLLLNVQPVISVLVSWFWLRERPLPRFYPWAAVALACGATMAFSPDHCFHPRGDFGICWGTELLPGA